VELIQLLLLLFSLHQDGCVEVITAAFNTHLGLPHLLPASHFWKFNSPSPFFSHPNCLLHIVSPCQFSIHVSTLLYIYHLVFVQQGCYWLSNWLWVACGSKWTSDRMKSTIFWDITYRLHLQGWKTKLSKKPAWKQEAICSSETSLDTQRTTWRYIPEDSTLHNHRCENLKSYIW
jgi:hypothetical protein